MFTRKAGLLLLGCSITFTFFSLFAAPGTAAWPAAAPRPNRGLPPGEGVPQSFMYGYNGTLVIAKVTNAAADQIFHTSFEEEPTGGAVLEDGNARTGRKSRTGDFVIPADKRPVAGQYVLSYWERVGAQWQYRELPVAYSPSDSPVITTANPVDEVRMHPKGAQMATVTYDPLVGKTSETRPDNTTLHYEYDEHNRLRFIRDQDGNVLKNYYYHYKPN